jgi:hypothetical protein
MHHRNANRATSRQNRNQYLPCTALKYNHASSTSLTTKHTTLATTSAILLQFRLRRHQQLLASCCWDGMERTQTNNQLRQTKLDQTKHRQTKPSIAKPNIAEPNQNNMGSERNQSMRHAQRPGLPLTSSNLYFDSRTLLTNGKMGQGNTRKCQQQNAPPQRQPTNIAKIAASTEKNMHVNISVVTSSSLN